MKSRENAAKVRALTRAARESDDGRENPANDAGSKGASMTETQRYQVVERIAAGGMAEVYRGESAGIEGFRKKVAIKKVVPKLAQNREFIHMFLDEARLCAYLSH